MEMTKPINLDSKIAEIVDALQHVKPVCLYGPTGTGKTIAGWEAAVMVAEQLHNEVVYIQMYPEITKSVLIGGETIKNGNIVVDTGPIIKMGGSETPHGAVFFIDEATHATEPAILGLNSLIEAPFQTVVGAQVHKMHADTRFLFAGNTPDHAGNVELPASFANRLYVIDFPTPEEDDLRAIIDGTVGVQHDHPFFGLQSFVIEIAIKTRANYFAISPRNVINCIELLKDKGGSGWKDHKCLAHLKKTTKDSLKGLDIDPFLARNVILATMLGNVVTKNDGPDKVKALLWWEE
jgi:hypothetical protein